MKRLFPSAPVVAQTLVHLLQAAAIFAAMSIGYAQVIPGQALDQSGAPARWVYEDSIGNDTWSSANDRAPTKTQLYSPDGASGRQGLLELRAFEMPPHARMSLTQQLLMRALVARFWRQPYRPDKLARWGTGLHDRFMLPHFVWQDFEDVLEDTKQIGRAHV